MRKIFVPAIAAGALFAGSTVALAGGASPSDTPGQKATKPKKTITEKVVASKRFDTLESLVVSAGLAETLSGKGPYTVFAPTDKAFAKVPKKTLAALGRDKKKLKAVLLYHVVAGKVAAADVVKLSKATTLNGADVRIRVRSGKVYVNKSRVTKVDVAASNGVIHVVNRVLIPPA
jgi:uncharacterized surface protein with fasciclin (FAS1) repeats